MDDPHQSTYLKKIEIKTLDNTIKIHPCVGLSLPLDCRKPNCKNPLSKKGTIKSTPGNFTHCPITSGPFP